MPELGYAAGAGLALGTFPLNIAQMMHATEQAGKTVLEQAPRAKAIEALRRHMQVPAEIPIFSELGSSMQSAFVPKGQTLSMADRITLSNAGLSPTSIEHLAKQRAAILASSDNPMSILAHEMGHASGRALPAWAQYSKKLMRPAMVASPILAAHLSGSPESSSLGAAGKGALIGGGLGGAIMSPVLAEELRATMRAMKAMRETGVFNLQQLSAARKSLGLRGAGGTYLAGALLPTAGLGAIGATYGRRAALAKKEETARRLQKALQKAEGR